ncbi:MAG: hypothetical protein ACRDG4_10300 [Chloroflexota bacterium]
MVEDKEGSTVDSNDGMADYRELVRLATAQGLQGLDSTIVQLPGDQNGHHGVVLATVTTKQGLFRAVGEAWRDLLPAARRGETLTVAEIRAKSRALHEAVGMPNLHASNPAGSAAAPSVGAEHPEAARPGATPRAGAASAVAGDVGSTVGQTASAKSAAPAPLGAGGSGRAQLSGNVPRADKAAPAGPAEDEPEEIDEMPTAVELDRPARAPSVPLDGLGSDMVNRLLQMTQRKATLEGNPAGEEEALRRLDSYFQRAFGHPLAEATRMEGQRVIQRLAADLSRPGAGSGKAVTG